MRAGVREAGPSLARGAPPGKPTAATSNERSSPGPTAASLWSRDPEAEILPTLRELGIGFVAYSPLGRGFLTGAITSLDDLPEDDSRRRNPRFQGDNFKRNLELVDRVRELAREKGVTAAQLALGWVLAQGEDIVPIPRTTRPERVEENLAALSVGLTDEDLRSIDQILPPGAAAGERYPEPLVQLSDV